MVTISDFNFAYMAQMLMRGANGGDREEVLLNMLSCVKGTRPKEMGISFRSIHDGLSKLYGQPFRYRCETTRRALINGLNREEYDILELFCNDYEKWKEEKEEEENERRQAEEDLELGIDPMNED